MTYEEIRTKFYEFTNFSQSGISVIFRATPLEGRDVTRDDIDKIREFLEDIGKWEIMIKGVRYLLSEIEIISAVSSPTEDHSIQDYNFDFSSGPLHQWVDVRVHLSSDERHLREGQGRSTTLVVQEIHGQIKNIPKWKSLQKMISFVLGSAER